MCFPHKIQIRRQQIMSSCSILGGIETTREGLNYLVPLQWWKEFVLLNHDRDPKSFSVPALNILDYSDSFLLEYKENLVDQLELKSNYIKCQSVKISLEPSHVLEWTPINPVLWKIIRKSHKKDHGIFTVLQQGKNYDLLDTIQIQIIFCSKNGSNAFVGYIPKKASLISTIRQVGFELGFIEVVKSKIVFLDNSSEVSFNYHQVDKYSIEGSPGTAFMAFNLERSGEEPKTEAEYEMGVFQRIANESNQAVVGDLNTMEDESNNHLNEPLNNRTMSTGAETPFSFIFSEGFDLDRQYRVKQIFGAKQPEEIEELKLLASLKIQNEKDYIQMPEGDEPSLQLQLDKLADELLDSFLKKKQQPKEKEMEGPYE